MLVAAGLGACAAASQEATPQEKAVLESYRLLEKALQTGDGRLWLDVHDEEIRTAMTGSPHYQEMITKGMRPRPHARYEDSRVIVQKDEAAVFGKFSDEDFKTSQYSAVRFVLENAGWKVAEELSSDSPIAESSFLPPPESGFFNDDPWQGIAYARRDASASDAGANDWKIQATFNAPYLYVRFEHTVYELPQVGEEALQAGQTGAPAMPPVVRLDIGSPGKEAGLQEYYIQTGDVTTTKAEFGPDGKATVHRYFVNYSLHVTDKDQRSIFTSDAMSSHPLIAVSGSAIIVKIPVESLGLDPQKPQPMVLRDAEVPGRFAPYAVEHYKPF